MGDVVLLSLAQDVTLLGVGGRGLKCAKSFQEAFPIRSLSLVDIGVEPLPGGLMESGSHRTLQ